MAPTNSPNDDDSGVNWGVILIITIAVIVIILIIVLAAYCIRKHNRWCKKCWEEYCVPPSEEEKNFKRGSDFG